MDTANKTKKYIMMVPSFAIMSWLHLTGQIPGGSCVDVLNQELEKQSQFVRDEIEILLTRATDNLNKAPHADAHKQLTNLICCVSKLTAALRENRLSAVHSAVAELVNM